MKTRLKFWCLGFLLIALAFCSFPFIGTLQTEAATTPSLIITEMCVYSGFEYVEIQNTGSTGIDLNNYNFKIYLADDNPVTGVSASLLRTISLSSKTIPAGGVMVIWIQDYNTPEESRDISDFNDNFGTSLTASQILICEIQTWGLPDDIYSRIVLCDPDNNEICYAKYNETGGDDTVIDSTIVYEYREYPIVNYKAMFKLKSNVQATPGIIPSVPSVMITELMPNPSYLPSDGTDMYEYIELYNTTDSTINLKDYKLVISIVNSFELNFPDNTDLYLEAGKRLVVWLYWTPVQQAALTVADFNAHYCTNLSSSELYPIVNVMNMPNGLSPVIVSLRTDADVTICSASYNNPSPGDAAWQNRSIIYDKPLDGTTNLRMIANNQQPSPGEEYQLLCGQLHAHSTASDGDGTPWTTDPSGDGSPTDAYTTVAATTADFFALTDHAEYFNNSGSNRWDNLHDSADLSYVPNDFTTFAAYEMGWGYNTGYWGHMNTFNTSWWNSAEMDYETVANMPAYFNMLATEEESVSQFNHPSLTFGDFNQFSYWSEEADGVIPLVELTFKRAFTLEDPDHGGLVAASGYFTALNKGWHVAPTLNNDEHDQDWYPSDTDDDIRTVILAQSSTRDNILDAIRNRRVYATTDDGLKVRFKANGEEMGSRLSNVSSLDISVSAYDSDGTDTIAKITIMTTLGTVLYESNYSSTSAFLDVNIDESYPYYVVMVEETDGDWAITAPIWIEDNQSGTMIMDMVSASDSDPCTVTASFTNTSGTTINSATIKFYKDALNPANLISTTNISNIASEATVIATMDNDSWTPYQSFNIIYAVYEDSTTHIIDLVGISDLMITEIVANSVDTVLETDAFEYVEVFNNTQSDIDLIDYKVCYRYSNTGYTYYDISSTFIIPAKSTILLWFGADSYTVDDFLAAYGLPVNDTYRSKVYKVTSTHLGNVNTCAVSIHKDSGSWISRAWYNLGMDLSDDADQNPEAINYKYSIDEDICMDKVGTSTTPTPLEVTYGIGNQVICAPCTIKYDANGGTGTMADTIASGNSVLLHTNTFTRSGYTFVGWYAYRSYDGKFFSGFSSTGWYESSVMFFSDGQSVTNLTPIGTVIMCAVWVPNS